MLDCTTSVPPMSAYVMLTGGTASGYSCGRTRAYGSVELKVSMSGGGAVGGGGDGDGGGGDGGGGGGCPGGGGGDAGGEGGEGGGRGRSLHRAMVML